MTTSADQQARAKRYEAIHNWVYLVDLLLTVAVLVLFLLSGASTRLADWARSLVANPWLSVPVYAAVALTASKLVFLPLNFFSDYWLEQHYELSNESLARWLWDECKSLLLTLLLGTVVLDVLYFLLRRAGHWWWLGAGTFFLLFGVVLSTLYPVLILPLFYKLQPLEDEPLRAKLVALAERVGARVLGVYRMAMSEKTKKANAAFAGLGRTKRIILGDTLLDKFTADEIEVVMAHEMAHYQHGDLWKMIGWSSLTTFIGFRICDAVFAVCLHRLGFAVPGDIGAFPLLALCLFGFGLVVMPLNNAFSRACEWAADRTALELTGSREAFIGAMRRLADQNLADLAPHPVIEFLLHDHPSLARRIAWAEQWKAP